MSPEEACAALQEQGWTLTPEAAICPHGMAHTVIPQGYEIEDLPQWDEIVHSLLKGFEPELAS